MGIKKAKIVDSGRKVGTQANFWSHKISKALLRSLGFSSIRIV